MIPPALPPDETTRLAALRALDLLDTPAEERFDRLTRLACRAFGVPIAAINLIDAERAWMKSRQGLAVCEVPRAHSFCAHGILQSAPLVVPDASQDPRFHDNPFVDGAAHLRFYAGAPIAAPDGSHVGMLCVMDSVAHDFTVDDEQLLIDLTRIAEQEMLTQHMATTDELTGIANRRGFLVQARRAIAQCRRGGSSATLLSFDLDGFKQINDCYGHAEGDRALALFAALLREAFRASDCVARIGGDEFVALLTNAELDGSTEALARLHRTVELSNAQHRARGYALRYSVGSLSIPPCGDIGIDQLLATADRLMYQRKRDARPA